MGNIIEIGSVYKSPKFDKYFEVLAIDKEDSNGYVLAVLWIDKVTKDTTPGDLRLSYFDSNNCSEVTL